MDMKPLPPPAGLRACKECPCWIKEKKRVTYFGVGGVQMTAAQHHTLRESNLKAAAAMTPIVVSACSLNPLWVETHENAYCWSQPYHHVT